MGQKKLVRFAELETFSNVLQFPVKMPGTWNGFFENKNPLVLELACGKGEYALGLAKIYPNKNFIGIDIKGNRLWVGAKKAIQHCLDNVAFLRIQIDQLTEYFATEEVDEIWITFPDPQLRTSRAKKRLTHPRFLRLYQQIMRPGGLIHLKTDSPSLYYFTRFIAGLYQLDIQDATEDVYARPVNPAEISIKTHYEKLDIAESKQVYYICFALPEKRIPVPDVQLQELLKRIEKSEQV